MGGDSGQLEVLGVAGNTVASLPLPDTWTIRHLKQHLHEVNGFPVFNQQLMLDATITKDSDSLSAFPQPLRLTLVVLSFCPEQGPELLKAAAQGKLWQVEQALSARADPDYADDAGRTPLHSASQRGDSSLVRCLCEAGANKDGTTHAGATPLFVASERGHLEVVRTLCDAGADKEKCLQDGTTPLFIASQNGHLGVVRLLCEAGAEKDKPRQHGATPMLIASLYDRSEVVRFLCEAGADSCKGLQDGTTPSQAASLNGNVELARFLEEATPSPAEGLQRRSGKLGQVMRRLQCPHRQARAGPARTMLEP